MQQREIGRLRRPVSVIGLGTVEQAKANAAAAELAPLGAELRRAIAELYDRRIRPDVHQRW